MSAERCGERGHKERTRSSICCKYKTIAQKEGEGGAFCREKRRTCPILAGKKKDLAEEKKRGKNIRRCAYLNWGQKPERRGRRDYLKRRKAKRACLFHNWRPLVKKQILCKRLGLLGKENLSKRKRKVSSEGGGP